MKRRILMIVMAFAVNNIMAQNPLEGFTTDQSGVVYKFEKKNDSGTKIKEGDIIIGHASVRLGDSITLNTFNQPSQPVFMATMKQNQFKGDLMQGLMMMRTGEVCTFAFPYDSIGKVMQLPLFFTKEQYAFFKVQIDSTTTEAEMRKADSIRHIAMEKVADSLRGLEGGKIEEYLKEKGYSNVAVNGIYYNSVSEGTGAKPDSNSIVKVHYVGRFLNGKLFDTSVEDVAKQEGMYQQGRKYEPLQFSIGKRQMIDGFERGVKMMKEGGKAIIVLPSALAYGGQQRGEIMPYSPLVFELELVSVEQAPAAAQPTPIKITPKPAAKTQKATTTKQTTKATKSNKK
ncbi:MAG: FKBP-type peptidyl-prolyl cis-trans isomerase [Bacteroidales bacterium]|nr:FKBP-type peptidyl-prolyl cis-trans isomerase [Bacteroidales bacterium]